MNPAHHRWRLFAPTGEVVAVPEREGAETVKRIARQASIEED